MTHEVVAKLNLYTKKYFYVKGSCLTAVSCFGIPDMIPCVDPCSYE